MEAASEIRPGLRALHDRKHQGTPEDLPELRKLHVPPLPAFHFVVIRCVRPRPMRADSSQAVAVNVIRALVRPLGDRSAISIRLASNIQKGLAFSFCGLRHTRVAELAAKPRSGIKIGLCRLLMQFRFDVSAIEVDE